jgi:membrane protein YqaA with SNARE-associated domain
MMSGVSVLMFALALGMFLAGIYLATGHKSEILLWKNPQASKMTDKEVRNVGKWTLIATIIPIIIGLVCLFIEV